ncbi:MAG: hypothetical protein ACC628_22860, partial [Pirellulaceae bacterium]
VPRNSFALSSKVWLTNCLQRKAKGRIVGKGPFAVRAFQPQNPGSIDANTVLHESTKGSPPALMDVESRSALPQWGQAWQ